jgi:hypothetical protein
MKCPLSKIDCSECGYWDKTETCFLRDLIEVLTKEED